MQTGEFDSILRILVDYKVDFIVVGGVAAILQGVPGDQFNLDVVHSRHLTILGVCWRR